MGNTSEPKFERNNKRPVGKGRDFGKLRPVNTVSWTEVDESLISATVGKVTSAGAAIMFGRTSDGGAYSITVLDGEQRVREWPHTVEECGQILRWIIAMFESD